MRTTKKNMIESQLKPEGITCLDTISCISRVNREDFVPKKYTDSSYAEFDIPLDNKIGATIFKTLEFGILITFFSLLPTRHRCGISTNFGHFLERFTLFPLLPF